MRSSRPAKSGAFCRRLSLVVGPHNMASGDLVRKAADEIFLALGQTLYVCQLFEAAILELVASANELLEGKGDGRRYEASIEALSRKTLGQLLTEFRRKADIREDIDEHLNNGLHARNFIVHHFAAHLGEDLADENRALIHQRTLYEKCAVVMAANDTCLSVLESIAHLHQDRCDKRLSEIEDAKSALLKLMSRSLPEH